LVAVEVVVVVLLFVLVVVVALVVVNEFCSQYSLPAVQFPVWSAFVCHEKAITDTINIVFKSLFILSFY
jgi:hypothetical protein